MTLRELPHDVEVNARQMDPFEGTAYRMLERLGGGDVAEVFAVEHRRLSMRYAAKLLRATFSSDSRTVERFRLEADALAKLEHENVVSLHAYDETPQGVPFIVMELLEGQTLEELLDQQRVLPISDALVFAIDLLNGLEAVHELGIVHRDQPFQGDFLRDFARRRAVDTCILSTKRVRFGTGFFGPRG